MRGSVFPAGSVDFLSKALTERVKHGPLPRTTNDTIRRWAADTISGEAAAAYLCKIIDHVYGLAERPRPPWQGSDELTSNRRESLTL